jgi:anti-anti-sigma factor
VERLTKDGLDKLTAMLAKRIGNPRVMPAAASGYSLRRTVAHAVRGVEAYLHLAASGPTRPWLAASRAQADELWAVLERAAGLLDDAAAPPDGAVGGHILHHVRKDPPVTQTSPPSSDPSPGATLTTARVGRVLVLRLAGELDLDSIVVFQQVVIEETTALVLDLSRLEFCDSTGLNVLLRLRFQAESRGIHVHLAATSPQVAQVLRITGADQTFRTHTSVEDALAGLAYD